MSSDARLNPPFRAEPIGSMLRPPDLVNAFNAHNRGKLDDARAGDFSPLRFMPTHKFAVLGIVSTKTPLLEDKAALRKRIEAAARYLPLERLAISPQCGFASTVGGNLISIDDERSKLRLVVEVANEVWR